MRPLAPSLPAVDDPSLLAVLRDGSAVTLKIADEADQEAVRQFFHDLSVESRRLRFFAIADPPDALIERLCDASDPSRTLTLLAMRHVGDDVRPIAVGSYIALNPTTAEAAFAVADRFQGKGLGTILLERLASLASAHGLRQFQATTLPENAAMLEVFQESGFQIRSKAESGTIDVRLSLDPTNETVARAERRIAAATAASLRPLLEPSSIAVVGASREPSSIGRRILTALAANEFTGEIFPVNPHASDLDGRRCYATVADLPKGVDLAVLAVPYPLIPQAVDQCAAADVKSLVVITAGFAEVGPEGRARQEALVTQVRGYGMRMIGPNCMGVINTDPTIRLNASFSSIVPPNGSVALSSQSGALGMAIVELAQERGVGLSTFVSVGNKADVSGNDLLEYWQADRQTSVVLLYLESFGNPTRFARLARQIGRTKPIVCVKAGRTRAGSRAAGSHTAALAASDAAVDACEAAGLHVVEFSAETRARLAEFLPAEASIANPVDMVASAGPNQYRRAIEVALTATDADALIVIYTPVDMSGTADTLQAIRDGIVAGRRGGAIRKPVLACLMAEAGRRKPLAVEDERVPAYAFPENAARALAKVAQYAEWRAQPPGLLWTFEDIKADDARAICRQALARRGAGWLMDEETRGVLGAFGLPLAASAVAKTAEEAAALAHVIGFPVAAKLASRAVAHKTDLGVVCLNLTTDAAVRRAFADITARAVATRATDGDTDGVLIQAMVSGGVETMIGVSHDPAFGPLVAFGLGGIHVEILGDVQFRIAPLTDRDVDGLLYGIRGLPLLRGYRGAPPADLEALRDLLMRVSRLAIDVPEVSELDLNPVIALPPGHGCRIVDARIAVRA